MLSRCRGFGRAAAWASRREGFCYGKGYITTPRLLHETHSTLREQSWKVIDIMGTSSLLVSWMIVALVRWRDQQHGCSYPVHALCSIRDVQTLHSEDTGGTAGRRCATEGIRAPRPKAGEVRGGSLGASRSGREHEG